ncbi:MAG TPA: hypothetical protein VLF95_10095 [Vicinamibacteria bacterium]|nr:hypothetical protein [Vicinamibacteria bacterium]
MLGAGAAAAALGWAGLPPEAAPAARVPLLLIAALLVFVFGTLTVEVDEEAIRLRFGIGLVRRRIPLRNVQGWREVRNPWYSGWGIRLGPGGVLWNVSGLDAVQLALGDGKHFRIGTDEPAALASAITRAKGEGPAAAAALEGSGPAAGAVSWKVGLFVVALGVALVGAIFWAQIRPPKVSVAADGFEVDTLFYGASFAATDVTSVSLEARLPRVLLKTNGFGGAGTLRGRFRLEDLGEGRLYVEQGYAPFVLVRLREGYVVVNFREPEKTQALYQQMARAWPDRVAAPAR